MGHQGTASSSTIIHTPEQIRGFSVLSAGDQETPEFCKEGWKSDSRWTRHHWDDS